MGEHGGVRRDVEWSLLPQDLVYDILTWVPFDSLHTCRRVCSAWRRITYEPNFIALHCHRTKTITGYFIQSLKKNVYSSSFVPFKPLPSSISPPSLGFLPKGAKILSSTHRGVLFCKSAGRDEKAEYYVCKPATQQCREIPRPRTRFQAKGVAIVASKSGILRFKIVRLSNPRKGATYTICEIFDSRTWRWTRHGDRLPPLRLDRGPGVDINGVVHWRDDDSNAIFAFDIVRESWWLIPLPERGDDEELRREVGDRLITECNGRLCLVRETTEKGDGGGELQILTAVDYSRGKWKMIGSERLVGVQRPNSVNDLYTRHVLFLSGALEALWLDLRRREVTRVPVDHQLPEKFRFESDLNFCSLDARKP